MKKLRWITSMLCCMMMLFTECSNPTLSNLFAKMEECQVMGVVRDEKGEPICDVEITSGREKTITNARGVFSFDKAKVKDERCVLSFQKEGYCSVTRSCAVQENVRMDVVMLSKQKGNTYKKETFTGSYGGIVEVGKVKVTIPGGVVNRLGIEHTDDYQAEVFYLEPNNKNFQDAIPGGDLEAIRSDNSSTFLQSYGMVDVTLTDKDGNPLQLGKDKKATLTFPVPAGMEKNTPDSIPLWAFNEDKGIWEEEGMAMYDAKAKVYTGTVSHFSWHNLDIPSERVTVKGKVTDCNGDGLEGIKVIVGQTSAITNASGEYSVYIPQNTDVDIYVRSGDYYNYKEGKPVVIKGTMEAEVEAPTLTLPCMCNLTGKIKNSCGERPLALIYVDYTLNKVQYTSAPVWSDPNDGTFSIKFPKNASMLMLHIESKDGNTIPRPYINAGGDMDAGEIEVCIESQEKEVINVTYGDKMSQINVNDQTLDVASDIGGIMGALNELVGLFGGEKVELSPRFITITNGDTVLTVHVKEFREGRSTYDAEISYFANGVEASGTAFFTVVEHKDKSTLLTLSCALTSGKKNTPVTLTGMFSIPDMANGMKVIGDIDHVPASCPSFPKPIFATFQYKVNGHWITGGCYKSVDYDGYKKKLLEAGAECLEEEVNDNAKELKSGVFYHKDFMVSIDPFRIMVMDKPSSKEKKKYTRRQYRPNSKKFETDEIDGYEIEIWEEKSIVQTLSTHPISIKEKK